jgi:acyl-CoA ligase (AMP-forming) (exosortase A-associated)
VDFLVHHLLRTSAARRADKEALVHADRRLSYGEASARVSSLARGLRAAGVARGDRVGIYLEACVPQALSLFAVSLAGGVFVPINSLLRAEQVAHIVRDSGLRVLITTGARLASLAAPLKELTSVERVVVVDDGTRPDVPLPIYDFDALSGDVSHACVHDVAIEKDLAAILYTSGSTGKPKGVMLTHAQILAGASIVSTYLGITEQERILAVLPFSFDAGMNQIMTAFQQGGTCVLINFVFAREIVATLRRERVTGLAGVPTLWSLLAQPSSTLERTPLPDLRYITNTGGAMPQAILRQIRAALPTAQVFLMYGLTEAFRSTYLPPGELDRRPTSMGKAIPNTEILVVNGRGELCKPGEVGELVHRGPTVSLGYWGRPDLTAEVLRPHPYLPPELGNAERVCYSGDLVKMDEDGFLYFVGRRDAMIKSSGYRISATDVEDVLYESDLLEGAAVIGVPDEILGQSIKAFVVPKDGVVPREDALIAFCASRLPNYMVPAAIELVNELPKTTSGKVDYPALRQRAGLA